MPRRYDLTLLEALKRGAGEAEFEGVKVLVKPIPEGGAPGDLDPRLLKQMRFAPLLARFLPKLRPNAPVERTIAPLRKMFNEYKGDVIADAGITTARYQVPGADGRQIPVRVYRRENAGASLPIFVYFHGGGFFGGGPDIVEQMCKTLARRLDCVALNVDYRLCPENGYPLPLDDCFSAVKWAFGRAEELGGDKTRLAVSGDSAGGNLAAAVTLRDRDEGTRMVSAQVLLYPVTMISQKHTEFYHGPAPAKYAVNPKSAKIVGAMTGMMDAMTGGGNMLRDVYLQGRVSPENPYASPALGEAAGLPPTMLVFGEFDFLAFDNFAYAKKLTAAGTPLKTVVYRGLSHGFADQIGVFPQAEDCMLEIAGYLSRLFGARETDPTVYFGKE